MGSPGIASKVFISLAAAATNIIMISQASSEHSICIVCRSEEAAKAITQLREDLSWELAAKNVHQIELIPNLVIVAIIGENMRGTPGMSGKLFSALGSANINVLAIAQGSSERNISFVIQNADRDLALKTLHRAFLEG